MLSTSSKRPGPNGLMITIVNSAFDMRPSVAGGSPRVNKPLPPHPAPLKIHTRDLEKNAPMVISVLGTPGIPVAADPECARMGHDTGVGCLGLAALVCCLPCGLAWLITRDEVHCSRCAARMPPQSLLH